MRPASTASARSVGISQLRNVLASWGAFVLSAGAGLFLSPFVVGSLGVSAYGVWLVITSLTGTLNIFDLGIRSAVIRFIAREHARGDHVAASRLAATARLLLLGASAIVLLIAAVLAAGVTRFFDVPDVLADSSRLVLLISAASLSIVLSNGVYGGILTGLQRLDVVGLADTAIELVRIPLVLVVLVSGGGLVGLALIGLLLSLVRRLILQRASAQLYPDLDLRMVRPAREDLRAILSVSAYSTLIYTAVNVVSQASLLVVGAVMPIAMVAYYGIGATLPTYAGALNRPIAQTVHPRASRLDALSDVEGLRSLIRSTGRLSALVLLPMVITFILRGHTFVGIWMGQEFSGPAGDVLAILGSGVLFASTRHVLQAAFVGSGRHRSLARWNLAEAIITVALMIVVARPWGIRGVALASVIPGIAMTTLILPNLARRDFGVEPATLWVDLWIRPIIAMIPFALLSWIVDRFWFAATYLTFFSQVAVCLPTALLAAYTLGLDDAERSRVRDLGVRVLARVRRHRTEDAP